MKTSETVLITGGYGLIGSYLSKRLRENGYKVNILSRDSKQNAEIRAFFWNVYKQEIEPEAIETADYIIHLAGANIGEKRWTKKRRQEIIDSRVLSGQLIFQKIKETGKKPKAFISASAVGYYGSIISEKIFRESDPPFNDFLGQTCLLWEQTSDKFEDLGIRTVKLRTGVVLSKKGGALQKMLLPVKLGLGSALGSGKQFMPWIHIDDLCNMYIKAMEDIQMTGAYNAVASECPTNKDFMKALAHTLNKPFWFPKVPAIFFKVLFGKMSGILLKGSRVAPDKIINAGFKFQFPGLEAALIDLVGKK